MDAHLGYEKNSVTGNNSGNSRNGSYSKKIQTEHGEAAISIPRDRNGQFIFHLWRLRRNGHSLFVTGG